MRLPSAKEVRPGVLAISDDADVKQLLVAYHRTEFLQMHREVQRMWCMWTDSDLKLFFIVAHFQNFPDAVDNGLSCWVIDLDMHTPKQASDIACQIQAHGSAGCAVPFHFVSLEPKTN